MFFGSHCRHVNDKGYQSVVVLTGGNKFIVEIGHTSQAYPASRAVEKNKAHPTRAGIEVIF